MIIRDIFCLFCIKTYVVTPPLNHLYETVQMMGLSFSWVLVIHQNHPTKTVLIRGDMFIIILLSVCISSVLE